MVAHIDPAPLGQSIAPDCAASRPQRGLDNMALARQEATVCSQTASTPTSDPRLAVRQGFHAAHANAVMKKAGNAG